jgi:hypothetical protein
MMGVCLRVLYPGAGKRRDSELLGEKYPKLFNRSFL